jgi:queuine tRNA-ribosyltransferase
MISKNFSFELVSQNKNARVGKISTPRGVIDTPAFMPVGTLGTVKGIYLDDLLKTGSQIILGNTYHLMLRPGINTLDKFSGLHKFIKRDSAILTD